MAVEILHCFERKILLVAELNVTTILNVGYPNLTVLILETNHIFFTFMKH